MLDCEVISTDVFIVGAGAAGIFAATRAVEAGVDVLMATSGSLGKDSSATWMAGGGLQAALYPPDSSTVHAEDTIRNGRYLSNQGLVYAIVEEAPRCIMDLEAWGEKFHKKNDRFVQYFLPGHTYARCFQREKEKGVSYFGEEHHKVLPHHVRATEIPVLEDFLVVDLLTRGSRITGAVGIDLRKGEFKVIHSKVVILANSGYSACYKHYLTGPSVTGWGHGMACRAGAEFIDMEFIDFYPYVAVWPKLSIGGDWAAMARYALSGKFYNKEGFEFWESYRKRGLTRAQAIFKEVEAGRGSPHGGTYLAFNYLPHNLIDSYLDTQRNAKWLTELAALGFDLKKDAVEVYISVMSTLGGCKIDEHCRTNVPGLYAAGELASGFDGAHTLAGNMMTFCFASGSIVGEAAVSEAKESRLIDLDEAQVKELHKKAFLPIHRDKGIRPVTLKRRVREIMWNSANVAGRTKEGLENAIGEIESLRMEQLPQVYATNKNTKFNLEWAECLEVENMLIVSEMTLKAALARNESRGLHFREDFPKLDPNLTKSVVVSQRDNGTSTKTEPIDFSRLEPKGA
ncbi:MAG: FAD-binding protein [Chloroflexota bacterium]|nr:FAD-binding protein [Chloroflexota bacterium]